MSFYDIAPQEDKSLSEDVQPSTAAKWQILLPMETKKRTKNCFAQQN